MKNKTHVSRIIALITCAVIALSIIVTPVSAAASDDWAAFVESVGAVKNALTLDEKYECLLSAEESLNAYTTGGGVPDAEGETIIAEYRALKEEVEASIARCEEFIEYVELALTYDGVSFVDMMENLEKAEALLDLIDTTYTGITGFKNDYSALIFAYKEPIEICESFIRYASLAANAETYEEASLNYARANDCKSNITILDYPGLDEAEENLKVANAFMSERLLRAKDFIEAVANIGKAENLAKAIEDAYAIIERDNVDVTAEGASAAYEELSSLKFKYDRDVTRSNKAVDDAIQFIFGFIF
jgi:hypothetical protein